MKILLINSDLAKNRGDRAITEGVIELIKSNYPDARITGLSECPDRDKDWFGIQFIKMDSQSLNPFDFIKLLKYVKNSDLILWGGGEILKDYTNKLSLWYWGTKIFIISLFNKNIFGFFQGIGPTQSSLSKNIIVFTVNRCKSFVVRDNESKDKLIKWGVSESRVIAAADPALIPKAKPVTKTFKEKLKNKASIDDSFLRDFICVAPRPWFHYKTGGLLPFKYKQPFLRIFKKKQVENLQFNLYKKRLAQMVDYLLQSTDHNILLLPMHMAEDDSKMCRDLKKSSKEPSRIQILDSDVFSPSETRTLLSMAKLMVGFRLHSNIIAISSLVSSINIYYVDKGRVFFDQIKQSRFCLPIEDVLKGDFIQKFDKLRLDLDYDRDNNLKSIKQSVADQQLLIISAARKILNVK